MTQKSLTAEAGPRVSPFNASRFSSGGDGPHRNSFDAQNDLSKKKVLADFSKFTLKESASQAAPLSPNTLSVYQKPAIFDTGKRQVE
jgi:hypothetical protein